MRGPEQPSEPQVYLAYKQIGREGSEHEPVFLVEVKVGKLPPAQGRGQTKRDAESAAATLMLQQLNNDG